MKNEESTELIFEEKQGKRHSLRHALRYVRRRKSFVAGLCIVTFFYVVAIFADFLAPDDYRLQTRNEPAAPSSVIHFVDAESNFHLRPFIYLSRMVDPLG